MFDEKSHSLKMDKSIEAFSKELSSLRTGRANAAMLDLIKVDVYGQKMPINQIGSITTPEPRMINIQVWDQNNVSLVDSAIQKSELGLNPQIDGQLVRLPIPDLSEERRNEIKKLIKTMGEKCKVSIRNIRREANDEIKKLLKSKEISEDEEKKFEKIVQTSTDTNIKKIDDLGLSSEDLISLKLSLNNIDTQLILLDDSVQALNNYRNQLNQVILEIQTQISTVQNSLNDDKVVQN